MESLTWFLTFALVGAWALMGAGIVLRPLPLPGRWSPALRRLLWGTLGVAALVAGSWGPELWSRTTSDHPSDAAAGAPAERSSTVIRTPVALHTSFRDVDADDRLIRTERRLALQLPVVLILFLGGVLLIRMRERSGGGRGGGAAACFVLAAIAAAGGCGGDASSNGESAPRPDRALVEVEWDTLVYLAPEPDDTLLYAANHAVASERGFWVLDQIGARVAHFDWEGELQWYAGRQGSGPGELLDPRMLELDREDRVWVLDLGNQRISGFDAQGVPVDDVSLAGLDARIHAFATDAAGERFFGMVATEHLRPVAIDREGRVDRGSRIRIPDLPDGSSGIALQGGISSGRDGDAWVYALTMGDGLFRMDGVEVEGERLRYPEWIPFSGMVVREEVDGDVRSRTTQLTEPNFSARGVALDDDRILVPFHGRTAQRRRLIDTYELSSGRYLESVLLPRAGLVGAGAGRIILMWDDPGPHLAVLRRRR